MLSKITEYLSISWATQRRPPFVPLVWSCFWHVLAFSSLLWLVTGSSTFYKRRSYRNQLLQRSASVIISGTAFLNYKRGKWYYKVRQVIESRTIFLQSRATFITRWDNNQKVVQYRRQMKETWEIDFGNLLLHSTLICLATGTLPLYEFFRSRSSVIIKRKKKSHSHHRRICVTFKPDKQLYRVVSCIENHFP